MHRCLEPEWLDTLPPEDPQAVGSRRDLRVLNAWMGNVRTTARALRRAFPHQPPRSLVDLGAGDGTFLLQLARQLSRTSGPVPVVLVDRQNAVSTQTRQAFEQLGWPLEFRQADVFEFLRDKTNPACEAVVTNLFLHHFPEEKLRELFSALAACTRAFVAVEPRRSAGAHFFSRLVGLLGCNAVTRHDAPISVGAGFTGSELSRCWPDTPAWSLEERPAGLFSHLFVARRLSL